MSGISPSLQWLRQPDYTGENRCVACTAVNSVIAFVAAAGIGAVWVPAGVLAFVVFAGTIYFRGYLVPGTPELTRRYLPNWLLRAMGKEPLHPEVGPDPVGSTQSEDPSLHGRRANGGSTGSNEIEAVLLNAGIVTGCVAADDLCLDESFEEIWWRRIRRVRNDEERAADQLATLLAVDPKTLIFKEEEQFAVKLEGQTAARWVSDAAFYADLAAESTLAEWINDWDELDDSTRTALIAGLRVFLDFCPGCEAPLRQIEDTYESCCSDSVVGLSMDCSECGATVLNGTY